MKGCLVKGTGVNAGCLLQVKEEGVAVLREEDLRHRQREGSFQELITPYPYA